MNIIVATDFSKPAEHAVELGAALCRKLGDRLVVAFALEPSVIMSADFAVDALERVLVEKAQLKLQELAERLQAEGVQVEVRVLRGAVVDTLAKLGHELHARLIVAGTHARGAVGRMLLGSVAERLVLQADRPVLVTRTDGDQGLLAWAKGDRPLHVAVAVDSSSASRYGIAWVKALRASLPVDVTFLNFYWPPEQLSRLGISTEAALETADPLTVEVISRELSAFVGELPGTGRVHYHVESNWGEMGSHLAFAASDVDADVLVLGTHQRTGVKRLLLGATVQPTLHAAIVPTLCVPGVEAPAELQKIPALSEVLAATDLSALGNAAVPYAYALVKQGGVVHLLHVVERHVPNSVFAFDLQIKGTMEISGKRKLQAALLALVPEGAEARGIRTEVHVVEAARVANGIIQNAERLGVDTVCVGSHGHSGLGKALVGGVAEAVLNGCSKPVFVVRGLRP